MVAVPTPAAALVQLRATLGDQPDRSPDEAPPFGLPGEHFAAALLWLALGAVGLLAVAPGLAAGVFLTPQVIAVTHSFTLGWITTSVFGALYQLSPVVLGVPARSLPAAHATFWVLQGGIVTLVAGTWWWRPPLMAAGWVALLLAVAGFAWNVLPGLGRAPRGRHVGRYVLAGQLALGLALALVAARIGSALGWWPLDRLGFLAAHAHLAAAGFATLTAIGVGSHLLPMFLLSHGHPEWPLRWVGPVMGTGLVAFVVGELLHVGPLITTGGMLMAAGVALHLYQGAEYLHHRTRRRLDPGLAHVAGAFGYLLLATALGMGLLTAPEAPPRLVVAYGVAGLLGWLALLIVGVYHKILPFLTWLHRFGDRVGQPGVPRVADLTSVPAAWTTFGLLAGGVAVLLAGVTFGDGVVARAGAAAFAGGTALLLGQVLYLAVRR